MIKGVEGLVATAVTELRRQEAVCGCTVNADGDFAQVDGSFNVREVVEAVLKAVSAATEHRQARRAAQLSAAYATLICVHRSAFSSKKSSSHVSEILAPPGS